MKQSERITNAIVEAVFGSQTWISGVHPLRKFPCGSCGEDVAQKHMESHAAAHERELSTVVLTEEDVNAMFSRSEQYRVAH